MKLNFNKGQRLILELSDKNVFEGNYEFGTENRIDLINIVDLETRNSIQGRLTFYQHEIISIKALESDDNINTDSSDSHVVSTVSQPSSNVIALPRIEYERLQEMTQKYVYFATVDKRYNEAISHLNNCENVGIVGLGSDFGPGKPIDLLVISSWDQVYIFDLFSYQYSNFPSDLKDILESQYIKKVGHNLMKLVECLWYYHQVHIKNIFDTQFADLDIERKKYEEQKDSIVTTVKERSLSECLTAYFNFPNTVINQAEDVTSNKWKERPLSNSRKVKASLLVVYLITLKNKLEKLMLKEFYDKLDDCVNDICKCSIYRGCVKIQQLNGLTNGVKKVH